MLYISRYFGFDRYGVADTDDGREEIVDINEIHRSVALLGIEIAGVQRTNSFFTGGVVSVYQPPKMASVLQAKTLTMSHILVKKFRSTITGIEVHSADIKEPVKIRLSDFGSKCADFLFANNPFAGRHVLTLVLDNKLEFTSRSFLLRVWDNSCIGQNGIGVVFDITELGRKKAEQVYHQVFSGEKPELFASVVDRPERWATYTSQCKDRLYKD